MNNKTKKYIISTIIFILIVLIFEFIDIKYLNGNMGTHIGIFLICLGIFIIIISRIKNRK